MHVDHAMPAVFSSNHTLSVRSAKIATSKCPCRSTMVTERESCAGRYYTVGNRYGDDTAVELFYTPTRQWQMVPQGLALPYADGVIVAIE